MLFSNTKIFQNNNIVIAKTIISNNYSNENYAHFPTDFHENNVTITNNLNGSNFIYAKYFFFF